MKELSNKLPYKLNIQLFAEDKKEDKKEETETLKVVREEYEKKLEEQKVMFEGKIEELKKTHIEEIKSLVSGREQNLSDETKKLQNEKKEESFEEQLLKNKRKNLGLKGGN